MAQASVILILQDSKTMSAITFEVTVVGTPDMDDLRALLRDIRLENARVTKENAAYVAHQEELLAQQNAPIIAENERRALEDPPLDPLPLLELPPLDLQPLLSEDVAGYESLLEVGVTGIHTAAIERARADVMLTADQTQEILLAVKDRVDAGERVEDILIELKEPKPLLEEIKP